MRTAIAVAALCMLGAFACSSTTPDVPTDGGAADGRTAEDGGACGQRPAGGTCKMPGGGCEAEICVGTTWRCPDGDTAAALTPTTCSTSDGGACGPRPVGGTCRKPAGGCEEEVCVSTTWQCPAGDTPVAVVPGSCEIADGGSD